MLSKHDFREIREIFFERIDRLEESMNERFAAMDKKFASLQEVVLATNRYIDSELRINLHQLEEKDAKQDSRLDSLEAKAA